MNSDLQQYIETEIIPRYRNFDKAHRIDHVRTVIEHSLRFAEIYKVDTSMAYTIAAYHDTGLCKDRKTHHLVSGVIIRQDMELRRWFNEEQIETMAQAAEDHRASSDHNPRSIYGRIVSEADRVIDPITIIRRTVQYGFAHYPGMTKEENWNRTVEHLHEKYAEGGYLKLWIPESPNRERLEELRRIIRNESELREVFERVYAVEAKTIRPAKPEDIDRIMDIMEDAKSIMRSDGNLSQWTGGYPGQALIANDIDNGNFYIIEHEGCIAGGFSFIRGIDPTYLKIYDGQWLDDVQEYAVIHRLASTTDSHGVAQACFRWCLEQCSNLRCDTHRDNRIMRHVMEQFGFRYCGIIHLLNGDERLAYQLIDE